MGHVDICRLLIESKASINFKDEPFANAYSPPFYPPPPYPPTPLSSHPLSLPLLSAFNFKNKRADDATGAPRRCMQQQLAAMLKYASC